MSARFRFFLLTALTLVVVGGLALLVWSRTLDRYISRLLLLGAIQSIIALSLNLVSGFTGQLSLGQAGFVGIGAYTTAILTTQGWPLPLALPVAVGLATAAGFLVAWPSLRLRGDYLAIMTLGFGEIIRSLIVNLTPLTGGAAGFKDIPPFHPDADWDRLAGTLWIYLSLAAALILVTNLLRSSYGRALISVREDETAAQAMGVDINAVKIGAFALSAAMAGWGGVLQAPFLNYLAPTSYDFLKSVDYLVIIVLGGMGSITGTLLAAFGLTLLQEWLRFLGDYRMVIYPFLMILMMLYRPQGLMGGKEFSPSEVVQKLVAWSKARRGRGGGHG